MALRVGSVLAGRYEITAPIAAGGMGEVWLATDRVLMRTVAAKVLKSEFTGDPSFLSRFRNEARHTAALTHQNIASVYDYGETEADGQSLAYLVMEYVEGDPLVTVLAQRGRLSPAETLDVVGQAAAGLSAAHRAGVVHRDIKPGNLIVRPDGVVKLTDFGIARARDATPLTRTGMVVGTAQYLSPEQAQGYDVTPASDVYSLGVLTYECLVGRRPFDGDSQVAIALAQVNRPPPPLPADVPPSVQALVERALAKDPAARWPDGAAFAAAVRHVAAGGGLAPPTTGTQVLGADAGRDPGAGRGAGQGSDDRTRVFPASPGPRTGPSTGPSTGQGGRQMPPLHGPPVNDPTTTFPRGAALGGAAGAGALAGGAAGGRGAAASSPDAPPSRRRRLLLIGAAALVLVLGGGVAAAQLFDTDERGGGVAPSTSVSTSTAPATTSQSAPTTTDRDDEEDEPTTEPEATTTEPTAPTTTAVPTTTAAPTTTSTPAPTTTAAPTTTTSASTQTTTTAPGNGNSGGNGGGTGSPTPPTPTTDGVGGGDGDGGDDEGGATAGRDR
ncbi:protein kinase [Modestobacter sp. I12A-02628]|uniref:non-specific serine/threonine protein kinase n=1 Tax=Goekera deserti TaxID=2497753 RepID=A0A7K3WFH8_9ACTN|nr:serine/threonine-protein kinase [Goekera deserti]MPR00110.1 protein kinase [Goekera deserti]NDI49889.1 protein kinase [Goekera deserti]NEL55251.1 protein kinase [Goekera deserti]